jgi:hypothetical protein
LRTCSFTSRGKWPREVRFAPFAILFLLAGCATAQPRRTELVLDEFLAFARPEICQTSPGHGAFMDAMVTFDGDSGAYPGRIAASPALSAAFGPIHREQTDDYQIISTPVSGIWLGMRLLEISQLFPDGGDPGDFHFVLDAPLEQVRDRLRGAGFPVSMDEAVILPNSDGYTHTLTLVRSPANPDQTIFGCGWN